MSSRWCAFVIASTACGSASPAVEPVPEVPPVVAVREPAAPAEPEPEPELAPAAGPPAIAPACRGARLDLRGAVGCGVGGESQPLPASIEVSLEPVPLSLERGAELTAAIVLTNTSHEEAVLLLDCRHMGLRYEMYDRRGRRVDVEGVCGPGGGGCGGPTYGFALTPEGQARFEFQLVARKETCGGTRDGAVMPKGTYELRVDSELAKPLSAKIRIY